MRNCTTQLRGELRRRMLIVALCAVVIRVYADEPSPDVEKGRRERLEMMKGVIDEVSLETGDESPRRLTRAENPVLRYTNPVTSAFSEGALFLWLDGKRPIAAVSPSLRDNGTIWWELSSLSNEPLRLTRGRAVVWQPKSCSRKAELLKDAPAPAESTAARLTQIRLLARKFQVREERRGGWQEGRLLTQPLYRWSDDKVGVIDGALFGYAETTDPELLLMIEAHRDSVTRQAQWYFTLAKMTSSPVTVSLNGQEIWSVGGYWKSPRAPTDPYIEAAIGKHEH
jgi:hypothetical protein